MSHFRLHTNGKERNYLLAGVVCVLLAVAVAGYVAHSIGTARAKSRETILIYTEEELEQYLLDKESEEFNLNGRYQLEEDLDLSFLYQSVGTNVEPFTGAFDGNGHVVSGLTRPLFGVMEKAEIENLFLSDAVIEHPFTYYDGEHYVDGYGALAAYAVDTVIQNCGMNGEIYTASPSEAEYLLEKASPSNADEFYGPGVQEATAAQDTLTEDAGISEEDNAAESSGPERGPGIETDSNQGAETGGEEETALPSEEEKSTTAVDKGTETAASSEVSGEHDSEVGGETAQSTGATEEGQTGNEEGTDTGPEEVESEGTKQEVPEPSQEDKADADSEPVQDEPAIMETVGYQPLNRQRLALKVSSVMEVDVDEYLEASPPNAEESPSMATPSNATGSNEEAKSDGEPQPEETELQYIGNPDGDIYILVTADRVTAGGLVAQTEGKTLISNSFALVTIGSFLDGIESCTGGLTGIFGEGARVENSYVSGLSDCDGVNGGFVAVNEGTIVNCYSTTTVGEAGIIRGAFTALGEGSLTGCVYDRQMACVDEEETADWEEATSPEAAEFALEGMNTADMTGMDSRIPGTWRKTEYAYPQIEYFAQSVQETVSSCSKASVIALMLPKGVTLLDIVYGSDFILPTEIDGQEIQWNAKGNASIDENNKIVVGEEISISKNEVPRVRAAVNFDGTNINDEEKLVKETTESDNGSSWTNRIRLDASIGNVKRGYSVTIAEKATVSGFVTWMDVGKKLYDEGARLTGTGNADAPFEIRSAEELAVLSYIMKLENDTNNSRSSWPYIELLDNIDLFGETYTGAEYDKENPNIDQALQWWPLGYAYNDEGVQAPGDDYGFHGTLRGNGHYVYNLRIDFGDRTVPEDLGFISSIQGGTLQDFGVASGKIKGGAVQAGGISGHTNWVTLLRCWNGADIEVGSYAGGLLGHIRGKEKAFVKECYNIGNIKSTGSYVGGIVGFGVIPGYLEDCYNLGTITGGEPAGGIAGGVGGGSITNCYNAGTVSGTSSVNVIKGENSNGISSCFFDKELAGISGNSNNATGLTAAQMKSWAVVYALNKKSMNGVWQYNENGYPMLGGTEMVKAPNWEAIGLGVNFGWLSETKPSGSGTLKAPYEIINAAQFGWFAYQVNSGIRPDACAILKNDIYLNEALYGGTADDPIHWKPIGTSVNPYTGTFSGNGHTVSNMRAEGADYQGLFGVLGANAVVRDVAVSNSLLKTTGSYAGGIAASIRGTDVTIERCRNTGNLEGNGNSLGGIVGYVEESGTNASITSCWNAGAITGTGNMAGGIIGEASQADGLVIEACYTTAGSSVTADGKQQVGGILGAMMESGSGSPSYLMTVRNCYNLGSVSGDSHVGGIAGQKTAGAAQVIQGCYNAGTVTSSSGNSRGAMIGNAADTAGISFCYYDKTLWDTSGGGSSGGGGDGIHGTGLSTELLKTWAAAYALNGQSRNQGTGISWTYDPSGTRYPVPAASSLAVPEDWEQIGLGLEEGIMTKLPSGTAWTKPGTPAGTGDGSSGNPYQLGTAEDLAWFAHVVTTNPSVYDGACADLTEPVIDMIGLPYGGNSTSPVLWKPIKSYSGTFGAGQSEVYELTGLHINTTSTPGANAGLFEQVTGTAANIGVVDSQFISSGGSQGAIAGVLDGGTIYQCYARGNVGSGALYTGGIAGQMTGASSEIKDCYNQETQLTAVGASSAAGGIAGDGSAGTIQNCYHASLSSGSVNAEESAVGTAGSIAGKIGAGNLSHCYSDQILSDSAQVTMFDTSSDKKRLEQTAGLNTTSDGMERKGADRVWFTSLQAESTRGMPTLKAPVFIGADGAVSPADQAEGRTISLSSAIPDAKLRAVHQENGSSAAFDLAADVGSKFQSYGKKNANQYLGFAAGNIDLGKVSSSLTQPAGTSLGTVSQLTLYNGAAYTCPDSRTILLDFASGTTRYEVRVELSGVSGKMLSVVLPVKAVLDISPDGSLQTAHSGDIRLVNDNDYPIEGSIESLKLMDGDGYLKLQPVKGDMDWTGRKGQITNMGVKLGIDRLRSGTTEGTGLTPSKLYYTPKEGAAESSWMSYRLKSRGTLWYQYFMEYAADPYYFKEPDKYGYTVKYRFSVAEDDYTSELHAEIGS